MTEKGDKIVIVRSDAVHFHVPRDEWHQIPLEDNQGGQWGSDCGAQGDIFLLSDLLIHRIRCPDCGPS